MAKSVKTVQAQTVEAVKQPVNIWRGFITGAGAIVSKPWRRYRANVFLGYMVVAVVVFIILAVLAKTIAYFTFDVTITHAVQTFNAGWFGALMYALSWIGFAPQASIISLVVLLFLYASGLKWETVVCARQSDPQFGPGTRHQSPHRSPAAERRPGERHQPIEGLFFPERARAVLYRRSSVFCCFWLTRCSNIRGGAHCC